MMTINSDKEQQILNAFGVLRGAQAFEDESLRAAENPTVLVSDLMAYIKGDPCKNLEIVEQAVKSNLKTRRQYTQLLKLNAVSVIAKPKAAHSGTIFEKRVGDSDVNLKLKQSKGDASQYYLIIELNDNMAELAGRALVLHATTDRLTERVVFPPVHDLKAHLIISDQDAIFAILQDHDVEIVIQ